MKSPMQKRQKYLEIAELWQKFTLLRVAANANTNSVRRLKQKKLVLLKRII